MDKEVRDYGGYLSEWGAYVVLTQDENGQPFTLDDSISRNVFEFFVARSRPEALGMLALFRDPNKDNLCLQACESSRVILHEEGDYNPPGLELYLLTPSEAKLINQRRKEAKLSRKYERRRKNEI